jgi:choline dehydrogenase-like flavoprotein
MEVRLRKTEITTSALADCAVYGRPSPFVAGSLVFPTSSHANPALTIATLSVQLIAQLNGLSRKWTRTP